MQLKSGYKNTPAHEVVFGLVAWMNSSPIINNLSVAFLLCNSAEFIKDPREDISGIFDHVDRSVVFQSQIESM